MKKLVLFATGIIMGVSMVVAQNIVDFEELNLEPESNWNGCDLSGSFTSKYLTFYNIFDPDWSYWEGFAYTNETDNTTYDFTNQYSSASGSGANGSENYATMYAGSMFSATGIKIDTDIAPETINGMYVSLNAYASLYMEDGNYYENGEHWFKLIIKAYNSILDYEIEKEIILADYRFSENPGFKFDDWYYVNMSWIQDADSLYLWFESSDVGDWGINTPTYVCLDDINYELPDGIPPLLTEISPNITIDEGEQTELLALAQGGVQPYSFMWDNSETLSNSISQNPTASPEQTTIYTVTITDALGNSHEKSVTVNVGTTNIAEKSINESNLFIGNDGILHISANYIIKQLEVFDIQGRKVGESIINSDDFSFNMNNFNNGVFIIRLYTDYGVETHKVMYY